jgi:hypothetical protein
VWLKVIKEWEDSQMQTDPSPRHRRQINSPNWDHWSLKRNQSKLNEKQGNAWKKGQGGLTSDFRSFLRHNSIAYQIQSLQSVA